MNITITIKNVGEQFYNDLWAYSQEIAKKDFESVNEIVQTTEFEMDWIEEPETELQAFNRHNSDDVISAVIAHTIVNNQNDIS